MLCSPREQAALHSPAGLSQESGAGGSVWQPQPQHAAGHQGTGKLLKLHSCSAGSPGQGSWGAERPWALQGMAYPQGQSFVPPRPSPPSRPAPCSSPLPCSRVPLWLDLRKKI